MELTFLGTSAGVPTRTRNMTSIILNLQQPTRAEMWLFDCGEGTQHQFLHTPYHPGKLNKIFITHLHGDHLFGLPGKAAQRTQCTTADEIGQHTAEQCDCCCDVPVCCAETRLRPTDNDCQALTGWDELWVKAGSLSVLEDNRTIVLK